MFNRHRNIIEYKQPQEVFCSNLECFNEIAKYHPMYHVLDDEALKLAEHFCFDCILEGKINE